MVQSITRRIAASEYLQMPESNQRTELLEGQIIIYGEDAVSPAPVNDHQRLVRRSSRVLEDLIPNGEVFTAPTDVHFDELNVTQPEIFWVAENSRCVEVDGKYWYGAPDLIIEVLSPAPSALIAARSSACIRNMVSANIGSSAALKPLSKFSIGWTTYSFNKAPIARMTPSFRLFSVARLSMSGKFSHRRINLTP